MTVLAPSNRAFEKLNKEDIEVFLQNEESAEEVTSIRFSYYADI